MSPRSSRRARAISVLLFVTVVAASAAPAPDALIDTRPVAETPWFTFYSRFGFNLYDAVLTSASARREQRPDPLHDGECFAALVQEEKSAWDAAVEYYASTVAATGDFSRERAIVRARLAAFEVTLDDDDRRDLALSLLFLEAAAPAWRACGWPEQDEANRKWVAELVPRLERHADTLRGRLEELFGRKWRRLPIAVDVVATAGWSGADTLIFDTATHTQISSRNPDYQGPRALEMIFHEASHELVSPRNGPIAQALATASGETGVEMHPSLWHGVLFVTVGEVARQALETGGEAPYVPVATTVFRGDWAALQRPLEEEWIPFVQGVRSREDAARQLLIAIGRGRSAAAP